MSSPQPFEQSLLLHAVCLLDELVTKFPERTRFEARLQILEAAASRIGGFSARESFKAFKTSPLFDWGTLDRYAAKLVEKLPAKVPHPSLSLSALGREPVSRSESRKAGAFYTDFRLAVVVAKLAKEQLPAEGPIIDPASGAGILLSGLTYETCGLDRKRASEWLRTRARLADTSLLALRAARISLSSFSNDLDAIIAMASRWYLGDSLLRKPEEWEAERYAAVIANPPWEKLKVTRHEFAKERGAARHYGAAHDGASLEGLEEAKRQTSAYGKELLSRYSALSGNDLDLYTAFTELFFRLVSPGGVVVALLPGGLIRSKSTEGLRREVIRQCKTLRVGILDNRARFFSIDTRFKFLALAATKAEHERTRSGLTEIIVETYSVTQEQCKSVGRAKISLKRLRAIRDDLSLPEVRNQREWHLFAKMCAAGVRWEESDSLWQVQFCREVDMTNHRPYFTARATAGTVPVVEGRMVHQHRFGARAYRSGSGRAAVWKILKPGASQIAPQFWLNPMVLLADVRARIDRNRAGFCDIAGQTNERSMMSAMIPKGHVCGNKVPTVEFSGPRAEQDLWLWIGMTNSFPFDWLLRRVLTTTVNYFVLRSIPLPPITSDSLPGRRIATASRELATIDTAGTSRASLARAAELRAEIDVLCVIAYGASFSDFELMLEDFPLLDRGQPCMPGETRSTITRDYVLLTAADRLHCRVDRLAERVTTQLKIGAVPYVPSMADVHEAGELQSGTQRFGH